MPRHDSTDLPGATGHGEEAIRTERGPSRPRAAAQKISSGREHATAAVHARDPVLRALFERADDGIAQLALDGHWLRYNQRICDLLGYTLEEAARGTFRDLTHSDDLDLDLATLQRLLAGEIKVYATDKLYAHKDGEPVWGHLTVSLVRTPDGTPDCFIATLHDVTERKRLEQGYAILLKREQATRTRAEATRAQLDALQALTDTALSYLTLDDLLRELLGRVTEVMGVDHVGIYLLDENGQTLTMRAAVGLGEEFVGQIQFPVGAGFVSRIAVTREPWSVDDLAAVKGVHSYMRGKFRAVVGVPLLVANEADGQLVSRLVGVLAVGTATQHRFDEADVHLLQRAADRAALTIHRALNHAAEQDARRRADVALTRALVSETQATERAERLNTILETMADGVAIYDAAGRPLQMNRAYRELYALERGPRDFASLSAPERVRLLHMRDFATGEPLPEKRIPIVRALRGETVTGAEADVYLRAFDGREAEVNSSAVPLRDPRGHVVGVISVLHELTERNRLAREGEEARADERAARQASQHMEEFLATAAHDLRSPLTATYGYIELAERRTERLVAAAQKTCPDLAQRAEAVGDRVADARRSTEQLTQLLTRLFDTAAARTGKLAVVFASCDLAALVREQVKALRMAAPGRPIRLHTRAGGTPIPVHVDAGRIQQVLINYVTNALKYSAPDRPVDVTVEAHHGQARVAVRDTGPGISEAEQARVWELFHRVPGVVGQEGAGSCGSLGLGLYICKTILEAHGGQVGVESTVGRGSTFWFALPMASTEP